MAISRRYFMFGTLLTGALPRPSLASLKALGYQSPSEKLNVAGIGAGGQALEIHLPGLHRVGIPCAGRLDRAGRAGEVCGVLQGRAGLSRARR
jgi:hypothetical protein